MANGPWFIIGAALLWSADGLLRRGLYTLPPIVIVFGEHLLGSILLLFFIRRWVSELRTLSRKEWLAINLVALCSGLLGTLFYTQALTRVQFAQFSVVVLLQQLQPLWAIAAAAIVLRERISRRFIGWVALALLAAYLISFKNLTINSNTGDQTWIAGLLALVAGLFWGSSTAISKFVLNKVSFVTATALRFILTSVYAGFGVFIFGQTAQLASITLPQIQALAVITLSTGLVALTLYYYGLARTPARITTLCELVWPASAIVIDYVWFKQTLSITQIVGIILLGVVIFAIRRHHPA